LKRRAFLTGLFAVLTSGIATAQGATKKPTPKATPKPTKKAVVKTPTPTPTPKTVATPVPQVLPVMVEGKLLMLNDISAPTSIYANVSKGGREYPLLVAKPTDRTLKVFTARCPHQGNILNLAEKNELSCDLHGARFDESTGKVLDGPTINNLESYQVVERNGALYINF
jgi:nitrite reductase/ring-hydroxylating ferredoxin subunit